MLDQRKGKGASPLVAALLAVILVLLAPHPSPAAPVPPSVPLTQPQFDALVDALSKAVAARLAAQAPAAATDGAGQAGDRSTMMGGEEPTSEASVDFFESAKAVLAAAAEIPQQYGRIPAMLAADANGGRTPGLYALMLLLAAAGALAAEKLLLVALGRIRRQLALQLAGPRALLPLLGLALTDAAGLFAVWLVSYGFVATWFFRPEPQSHLAYLVLSSVFFWRLYLLVFRLVLRPGLPQARLAAVADADAGRIYRGIGLGAAALLLGRGLLRILVGIKAPDLVVAAQVLIEAPLASLVFILIAWRLRDAVARWIGGTALAEVAPSRTKRLLARHWFLVAVTCFVALAAARIHGAVAGDSAMPQALLETINILIGVLLLESLLNGLARLVDGPAGDDADRRAVLRRRIGEGVVHCGRLAIVLGALVLLARTWVRDAMGMVDSYAHLAQGGFAAGVTLFGAYCAWQVVKVVTEGYSGAARAVMPGGLVGDDPAASAGSRLSTLMPLLRVLLVVVIAVMAVLTALSQLGINITPLIAGASIAGLAISFGSQTLVKDVVSGVFYLFDDAFRVGEYIDCGKAKGTVEGFTLRSLRLRHQNGPVHTIPFGQLGQITNYSRDWATLKFNLRFARNTDLEKLRKATKRIGQEMLEDPDLKDEFLLPLKMQGVTDITDYAVVVRFKFTVKPSRPTFIQREAIKRMLRALPEAGIEFANATVAVQALSGMGELSHAHQAAAAQQFLARASAEGDAAPAS